MLAPQSSVCSIHRAEFQGSLERKGSTQYITLIGYSSLSPEPTASARRKQQDYTCLQVNYPMAAHMSLAPAQSAIITSARDHIVVHLGPLRLSAY